MDIRLATTEDLPILKTMFDSIVDNMNSMNIRIWNEYYPYEEFEIDIENKSLYVITIDSIIVATLGLFRDNDAKDNFKWNSCDNNAMYIARVGVNVDYLRQGIGSKIIDYAKNIVKNLGITHLRLLVAEINTPAINLYKKNNFRQIEGVFEEYSPTLNKIIKEYGFELEI